ncbi:MAG TPA: hypothetical protein VEQ38_16150 [Verrucomicrobiae bacterium]|nr:hypothetical protein [Verrucomicrobiae bacterium]
MFTLDGLLLLSLLLPAQVPSLAAQLAMPPPISTREQGGLIGAAWVPHQVITDQRARD